MYVNTSLDNRAVPMTQILNSVQALTARGFTQEQALVGTGLVLSDLDNLDLRVSYRQRIQQLGNMLALIGDNGFGSTTQMKSLSLTTVCSGTR